MTDIKTVLIRDVHAQWYAEQLGMLCPEFRYVPATSDEEAIQNIEQAEIIVGLAPALRPAVIGAATRLEWVQALTTGVDNLLAMKELSGDVLVTNCNGFHGPQMSELAILMMLSLSRDFPAMIANQGQKIWERWPQPLLWQKAVSIVGVGVIAEDLAARCAAFGMNVTGVSDSRTEVTGFSKIYRRAELGAAAAESDFLVVLTPYNPETHHLINAEVLAAMQRDAYLINLSRGGCVDETALIAALEAKQISGAALDVFETEPLPPSHPIWTAPRILITPHIGGMSNIYREQALPVVAKNLSNFAANGPAGLRNLHLRA